MRYKLTSITQFRIIKLTDRQLQKASDIFADIGTVMVASVVIPSITTGLQFGKFALGIIISLGFWLISINILKTWIK